MDAKLKKLVDGVDTNRTAKNGRPVEWIVPCAGSCGGGKGHVHVVRYVRRNTYACDCPAGVFGRLCKHVIAVLKSEFAWRHCGVSVWKDEASAKRQHKHIYKAQVGEVRVWITETKDGVKW